MSPIALINLLKNMKNYLTQNEKKIKNFNCKVTNAIC